MVSFASGQVRLVGEGVAMLDVGAGGVSKDESGIKRARFWSGFGLGLILGNPACDIKYRCHRHHV